MLQQSSRPLVLVGSGVRIAGADEDVLTLIEALGVPVMTTWPAMGIVGEDHPLVRRAPRAAWRLVGSALLLQSADFLLCTSALGSTW